MEPKQMNTGMASITVNDLRQFHFIDREIFYRLVILLVRDPGESLLVIALWLWLEEKRFPNIIENMLDQADFVLNALAKEAVACLNALTGTEPPVPENGGMPLTTSFMGRDISFQLIYQIKFTAISEIKLFLKNVCALVFTDILQQALRNRLNFNEPLTIPGFPHPVFGSLIIYPHSHNHHLPTKGLWGWSLDINVPVDDRTMFLTFSRGYPVTENEVRELFNGHFGDCVDNVWMDEYNSTDQSLYARMEVRTVSNIDYILGGNNIAKFRINGKHVWARKFERRDISIV